jgi:hypothetical protein
MDVVRKPSTSELSHARRGGAEPRRALDGALPSKWLAVARHPLRFGRPAP